MSKVFSNSLNNKVSGLQKSSCNHFTHCHTQTHLVAPQGSRCQRKDIMSKQTRLPGPCCSLGIRCLSKDVLTDSNNRRARTRVCTPTEGLHGSNSGTGRSNLSTDSSTESCPGEAMEVKHLLVAQPRVFSLGSATVCGVC